VSPAQSDGPNIIGDQALRNLAKRVAGQTSADSIIAAVRQELSAFWQELDWINARASSVAAIASASLARLDLREFFLRVSAALRLVIRHQYAGLTIYEPEKNQLRLRILDFPGSRGFIRENLIMPVQRSLSGTVFQSATPMLVRSITDRELTYEVASALSAEGLKSACFLPLRCEQGMLGTLNFGCTTKDAFSKQHLELLEEIAPLVGNAVMGMIRTSALTSRSRLPRGGSLRNDNALRDLIGSSPPFTQFLGAIQTVASTDATVLVLGETGTGKELIAHAIHNLSPRRERNFVTINCTAIPEALLESELFGHERGAFTGAIAPRVGRFEMAHGGTLFLDEIGDMPMELQSKLLRVLQLQQFERLGSSQTVSVDVRIVAATNRDLPQLVRNNAFRSDLFYRLNVFPVHVPPLRVRGDDVIDLAEHFVRVYAARFHRLVERIAPESLDRLRNRPWPGNVRELEHMIERAVILAQGPLLEIPVSSFAPTGQGAGLPDNSQPEESGNRIKDAEHELIRRSLQQSEGIIGGPRGAAALLGLKRSTLQSKMKKMGISTPAASAQEPKLRRPVPEFGRTDSF